MSLTSKPCAKCGIEKPLSDFGNQRAFRGGKHCWCLVCARANRRAFYRIEVARNPDYHREKHLRQGTKYRDSEVRAQWVLHTRFKRHGLTLDQYHSMAERQNFLCAICETEPQPRKNTTDIDNFAIDHDHATGKVRGLICLGCNIALGHIKDDPTRAFQLAEYLLTHAA